MSHRYVAYALREIRRMGGWWRRRVFAPKGTTVGGVLLLEVTRTVADHTKISVILEPQLETNTLSKHTHARTLTHTRGANEERFAGLKTGQQPFDYQKSRVNNCLCTLLMTGYDGRAELRSLLDPTTEPHLPPRKGKQQQQPLYGHFRYRRQRTSKTVFGSGRTGTRIKRNRFGFGVGVGRRSLHFLVRRESDS